MIYYYMIEPHFFTPLNIYNGTPEGVLSDVPRATLPINQLKSTDIFDVRSNSNVHRCIKIFVNIAKTLVHVF